MSLLLAFTYQWIAWIIPPRYLFLSLITYQYQLKDLILPFSSFIKLLSMLVLMRKENKQDQAQIFQHTYFESSQIH